MGDPGSAGGSAVSEFLGGRCDVTPADRFGIAAAGGLWTSKSFRRDCCWQPVPSTVARKLAPNHVILWARMGLTPSWTGQLFGRSTEARQDLSELPVKTVLLKMQPMPVSQRGVDVFGDLAGRKEAERELRAWSLELGGTKL